MKKLKKIIFFNVGIVVAALLGGCAASAVKSDSVSVSAPALIIGELRTVNVNSEDAHSIKPSSSICGAWSYAIDTSSIGESIKASINSSFDSTNGAPIFDVDVDVDQELEISFTPGFWSATAEGEAELDASVTVRKNGEHLFRKTYNVSADDAKTSGCPQASQLLVSAVESSTKKLVNQIVEDLELEIARRN